MRIKVIVWQENDVWCASVPALKGCHTWGETYEDLIEMVKDAVSLYLEEDDFSKEDMPQNSKLIELAL